MKRIPVLLSLITPLVLAPSSGFAEVKPTIERGSRLAFKNVPAPSDSDAASQAKFTLVDGQNDNNSPELSILQDGKAPTGEDRPRENFFFAPGTDGGRIAVDLGKVIDIREINTFSLHGSTRAPQVYSVYGHAGIATAPKKGEDPTKDGWVLITRVDSRATDDEAKPAHGVSIANDKGTVGKYRHLLFDISKTESESPFGNTFFSEIDVVDAAAPKIARTEQPVVEPKVIEAGDGKYRIALDTAGAPDLTEWAEKELGPVVQKWYPIVVDMLPSPGFKAPERVLITFTDELGGTPAAAAGSKVMCNTEWFRRELKREAKGAVVHELVHVVQQYGWGRRRDRDAKRTPGWISEGIPDYIRWFLYEPETRGAEITKGNLSRAKYDASYRVSANFINWVTETHGKEVVPKVNAAAREGKYEDALWKELTGKTVEELGEEWKKSHETRLAT
ncbi:MAG: basic secretory protein-like protein, partial [Chthoniobacteraceae bacterium]